jgi:hypothetical protein
MIDTPNPKVGEYIKVRVRSFPTVEEVQTKIVSKRELVRNEPAFTTYFCKIGRKMERVSWNPLIESFSIPDYTD